MCTDSKLNAQTELQTDALSFPELGIFSLILLLQLGYISPLLQNNYIL